MSAILRVVREAYREKFKREEQERQTLQICIEVGIDPFFILNNPFIDGERDENGRINSNYERYWVTNEKDNPFRHFDA